MAHNYLECIMKNSGHHPLSNTIRFLLLAALVMGLTLGTGQKAYAFASPSQVALGAAAPFVICVKNWGDKCTDFQHYRKYWNQSDRLDCHHWIFIDSSQYKYIFHFSAGYRENLTAANYATPTPANLTTAVSNMEAAYTDAVPVAHFLAPPNCIQVTLAVRPLPQVSTNGALMF